MLVQCAQVEIRILIQSPNINSYSHPHSKPTLPHIRILIQSQHYLIFAASSVTLFGKLPRTFTTAVTISPAPTTSGRFDRILLSGAVTDKCSKMTKPRHCIFKSLSLTDGAGELAWPTSVSASEVPPVRITACMSSNRRWRRSRSTRPVSIWWAKNAEQHATQSAASPIS